VTLISFKEFSSIPVAVTMASAVILLPESSTIPSESNSLIVSVITEALLFLIASNKSLSGTRHIL
jgi:hypothetical protein